MGHLNIQGALVLRAPLRPHREPASRIAWVLVFLIFPVGSAPKRKAYLA